MINEMFIVLLFTPLVASIINGCNWAYPKIKLPAWIACTASFISFFMSCFFLVQLLKDSEAVFKVSFFNWINIDFFKVSFSFLLDSLSVFMLLIITGVGFLIHLFSVYYMSDDSRPAKYFAYLNLFIFNMMFLVLADNLLLMFIGWEGVGLCSYLLIGFWFKDLDKAKAGMKAFIVNRIGDVGFLIGIFILFTYFGSVNFQEMALAVNAKIVDMSIINLACLCLFVGAIGKSAQIPLYVWLPSAMAGPTPVSALIHAATMVTAGIYLIVRMGFLFTLSTEMLLVISWLGALTALLTAVIACAQKDIKKVLAYSTVSQLGYMFVATGLGAFVTSLFHLMTHAFFKALLFLSAGAIIHALNGEQNIYRMGGLRKHLPWTWFAFSIGFVSLIGLPPFSGFFSKDEILWAVFSSAQWGLFGILALTALLTVFYMTRLFILTFYGESRLDANVSPHEGGMFSKVPLILLAVLSATGGVLGLPHVINMYLPHHPPHLLEYFLKNSVIINSFTGSTLSEIILMGSSSFIVLVLVSLTVFFYLKRPQTLACIKQKNSSLVSSLEQGLWIDCLYNSKIVKPVMDISDALKNSVDLKLIQGIIFMIQKWILLLRQLFLGFQNGKIQNYMSFMLLGLIILILCVFIG